MASTARLTREQRSRLEEDDAAAQARARRDAFVAIARDLPDPADYVRYLPLEAVEALRGAWLGRMGWRVEDQAARRMQNLGLAGCGGPFLTAFGLAVRRAVLDESE